MAKLLKLRLGMADDPGASRPSLPDCLGAVVEQAELLMTDVIQGLVLASAPTGPRRIPGFSHGNIKLAVHMLDSAAKRVCATYKAELGQIVYEGGGKEQVVATEALRFEDLQLFGAEELDQSIEIARAQQEVQLAVDDVLPKLDALVSTLLGWRTIQPGLNPVRPEVFVVALQRTLARHVPDDEVREVLIAPASGLLGVNLRRFYTELSDWLQSSGVEPAVPIGGRLHKGSGATGAAVNKSVAKTLLTLDRLRKLLAGEFDQPQGHPEFLHTVPASLDMLEDSKQMDALVKRLEERPRAQAVASRQPIHDTAPPLRQLGAQLGAEVVRLMFDTLAQDVRLLRGYKARLKLLERAVLRLAEHDSRFFSDREHPARQLLDRLTQRALAFGSETEDGWPDFLKTVDGAVAWLDSRVVDAGLFSELLAQLQLQWADQDQKVRRRGEEAARALQHAEQRSLLAQKLATEFQETLATSEVAPFVVDFVTGPWSQVMAESQLSCTGGVDDPFGYRALVKDLVWSVQSRAARPGGMRRLTQMVPALLSTLREGLARIDYPAELGERFFADLLMVHQAALEEGRASEEPRPAPVAAAATPPPAQQPVAVEDSAWLVGSEAAEAGWLDGAAATPPAPDIQVPAVASTLGIELHTGTWVELLVDGTWTRVQLTWASPRATLFMFTSVTGTAHSMSRRTLDRLLAQGAVRVLAERHIVDEALDEVAKAALRNSVEGGG